MNDRRRPETSRSPSAHTSRPQNVPGASLNSKGEAKRRPLRGRWGGWVAALPLAYAVLAQPGCSLVDDVGGALDDLNMGGGLGFGGVPFTGEVKAQVLGVLGSLFPTLSTAELERFAVSLSVEEVLALQRELEAARKEADAFSRELAEASESRATQREEALEENNGGFPEGLGALGVGCFYDSAERRSTVQLSGIFQGQTRANVADAAVRVRVDGELQEGQLSCLSNGESVDIVFLIDITGSMSNVIAAVRDSVVRFVDSIQDSGLQGTLSVVTFQDTVGVNVEFQEPAPANNYERSPFFRPVSLDDEKAIEDLRAFIKRLEANRGADAPENLAGAVDFARNSTIGSRKIGTSSLPGVEPFPALPSQKQVFIALTDVGFHADVRGAGSSSLLEEFDPRPAATIAKTLQAQGTVVHVLDPSWVDEPLTPTTSGDMVDADYWAQVSGGLGQDVIAGYSLVDLESVIVAKDAALLDVYLDSILATSCSYTFEGELSVDAELKLELEVEGEVFAQALTVARF